MKCVRMFAWLLAGLPLMGLALDQSAFDAAVELYTQRKPLEAQQAFEAIAKDSPDNADVQFYLGRLALQREEAPQAIAYLEKATTLRPGDSRFLHRLGDAYGMTAQKAGLFSKLSWAKKCLTAYTKAVELDPQNVDARLSLIEYYRQAPGMVGGGIDKAYAQAEEVKKIDPARGRAVYATLYASEKKYAEAFALYEEDVKADPAHYASLYQIGRLAAVSGQNQDRGIETLRACLTLTPPANQPGHSPVNWRLGQLLQQKNDLVAARAAYAAAIAADPNFQPAQESLKALDTPK